jgi:hypothetical protein
MLLLSDICITRTYQHTDDPADYPGWLVWSDPYHGPVDVRVCPDERHTVQAVNIDVLQQRLAEVDPVATDHDVLKIWQCRHYSPSYVLVVRPDSKCAEEVARAEAALESYPVLDDEELSRRESEAAEVEWERMSAGDKARLLESLGLPRESDPEAARAALDYQCGIDAGELYWHRQHGSYVVISVDDDPRDVFAGQDYPAVLDLANMEPGTPYTVHLVYDEADAGEARLARGKWVRLCGGIAE